MLKEKELIKGCLKNDEKALDELYKRFSSKLFGICLRYAKNKMEAEDLLHDGFIRVLDNLKHFRFEGVFEGWLRRIMVTTAINFYKKNKRHSDDYDLENFGDSLIFENEIISKISTNELMQIVQSMPQGYKMVFNLFAIEGYKHREIAEIMNISESTSKTQFAKARKHLQVKILEELMIANKQ